jgi:hypothetical protein
LKTRQNELEDLSAVYQGHRELFFEDEKDKKENILQLSTENHLKISQEDNESEKNKLYLSYEPEIQPRDMIETREYLVEVGIKDEMQKIDLYKKSHSENPNKKYERLNVENPINKVSLTR